MCSDGSTARALAHHGTTMHVYALPDGHVRLDLGPASVILARAAFVALTRAITAASTHPLDQYNGIVAGDPITGAICRCRAHGTLTLAIDRVALRLAPKALPALAALCEAACMALDHEGDQPSLQADTAKLN